MIQNIIAFIIIAAAVIYLIILMVRKIQKAGSCCDNKSSYCDGCHDSCDGCPLKKRFDKQIR